ncbi:MAG: hypothetical protein UR22_C0016G0005 [Parcubacteria group bacterium GW2011_GWC2_32_10]|nr:MAG: hypothetical protein UR22_C0016G0005 [Parcubacteria group bacterium GW2011_GWC2_32_10]
MIGRASKGVRISRKRDRLAVGFLFMNNNSENNLITGIIAFFIAGYSLYCEMTQDEHFLFRIIIVIVGFIVGGYNLLIYWMDTADDRTDARERRQEEHKLELKEREEEELAKQEGIRQQREEAYFVRLELRKKIEEMPKYNNWREKVFEKYGRKCEICGGVNDIEIHHRTSFDKIIRRFDIKTKEQAFECDALWNIDNGSVLCHECHIKMESSKIRSSHN